MAFGTQGLEICTSMRAKEALPIGSAFVARLGTHVTEVRFGAKQNEGQKIWQVEEDDPDAATLIHAHLAMPFCYWIISHNHNFSRAEKQEPRSETTFRAVAVGVRISKGT